MLQCNLISIFSGLYGKNHNETKRRYKGDRYENRHF